MRARVRADLPTSLLDALCNFKEELPVFLEDWTKRLREMWTESAENFARTAEVEFHNHRTTMVPEFIKQRYEEAIAEFELPQLAEALFWCFILIQKYLTIDEVYDAVHVLKRQNFGSLVICVTVCYAKFFKNQPIKHKLRSMTVMNEIDFCALLNLPEVEIEKTEINSNGDFLIHVKSTKKGGTCHCCGNKTETPYGYDRELKIRHLPVFGRDCYMITKLPRYKCMQCPGNPITAQQVSWRNSYSSYTVEFEKYIVFSLINPTIEDVSVKNNTGAGAVEGIVERYISSEVDWGSLKSLELLGIDGISFKKGHKDFVTLITAHIGDETRILSVLKDKKKDTVKDFFLNIPKKLRKTVKFICSDMYDGFINAAKEVFGKRVKIVIDRFHVAKLYRKSFDDLRKSELKRIKNEIHESEYKKLNNAMWILRKNINEHTEGILRL